MEINELLAGIENYKLENEYDINLLESKKWFREVFPLEDLDKLPIERYILQKDNYPNDFNKTFVYELERGKKVGVGIKGGNASKSYIYMDGTGKYLIGAGAKKRYVEGAQLSTEYTKLMSKIKKSVELAKEEKFEEIEVLQVPIFKTMLLKIIAIYLPDEFLDIYAKDKLSEIATILEVQTNTDSAIELNYRIVQKLNEIPKCKEFSNPELTCFLYEKIALKDRKPVYWSLNHTYQGIDMLDKFIEKSKIGIGYCDKDLSEVIASNKDLKDYLVSKGEDQSVIKALKDFSNIKAGDIVYLQTSFNKGRNREQTVFILKAVVRVLEDVKTDYEFDDEIKHCISVEFLSNAVVKVEDISYMRTISKVANKDIIDIINNALKAVLSNGSVAEEVSIYNEIENFNLNEDTKNFILYGPPGTGKTYNVINKALQLIDEEFYSEIADDREKVLNRYKQLVDAGQIEFCTFHQSYGYEEFVEGLKSDGKGNFEPEDGVLKKIAMSAAFDGLRNDLKVSCDSYDEKKGLVLKNINREKAFKESKKYVLIIDEINRGNISKIFGELITLLEDDKRIGTSNHITVNLPYTKEAFSLPSNLYIIGTMNTSDKSIAQIDIALRRRFSFIEMPPVYDDLEEVDGIDLEKALEIINKRIEFLIDKDHLIGHAYFVKIKSLDELIDTIQNKIIPLLQEYFYGDNEKVGMVLGGIGDEFIVSKKIINSNDLFKGFKNISDLGSKEVFEINEDITIDRIRKIYE